LKKAKNPSFSKFQVFANVEVEQTSSISSHQTLFIKIHLPKFGSSTPLSDPFI